MKLTRGLKSFLSLQGVGCKWLETHCRDRNLTSNVMLEPDGCAENLDSKETLDSASEEIEVESIPSTAKLKA